MLQLTFENSYLFLQNSFITERKSLHCRVIIATGICFEILTYLLHNYHFEQYIIRNFTINFFIVCPFANICLIPPNLTTLCW